ncbi:MAG TPA: FtsX-like permease family protein [Candidatus Dormibacteraeota bacterium]|nr:FtsX-like permease family protein [Candidatus Dormibacteraeota bacterium]
MPVVAVPPLFAALRWRAGASAALLAVAVLAVFTAAAGPIFLGTADTEVLHAQLATAGAIATTITVATGNQSESLALVKAMAPLARHQGLSQWYRAPTFTQDEGVQLEGNVGDVVSRTGICQHLQFISGSCPTKAFQIAMTGRDAARLGLKVGSSVTVPGTGTLQLTGITKVGNLDAPYWLGDDFFQFAPQELHTPPYLDAFFTPAPTLSRVRSVATVQFPLAVSRTRPDSAPALSQAVGQFSYVARTKYDLPTTTRVGQAVTSYYRQANSVASIVGVVALQLLLLTLFVLYVLVARTALARRSEVALAKLRGATLLSLLVMGVAEPAVILLVALPIGLVGAYLAMELASRFALDGAPVPFSLLAVLAALTAFASGLVATVAGSRRLLTRPLIDELRAAEDRPSPVARAAWEGAALALAGAGLLELATAGVLSGGRPNPIALFAPGLIAIGVAVPGTRLLPIACAYLVRRTRYSRHLAAGLAVRQVIRRPAALRQVLILTVAVGLSAFAIIGWSVAGTNRSLRAEFDLGAAQVVHVTVPPSVSLVNAVRRADPAGRYAMAVMESRDPNLNLIAVDASRLARVAYWPKSISRTGLAAIVRWLQPKLKPPLILTGNQVRATIDLSPALDQPPDFQINLIDSGGDAQEADFGYLLNGTHSYTSSLPPDCAGGCRVTSFSPVWSPALNGPNSTKYAVTISGLEQRQGSTWHGTNARIYQTSYWGTNSPAAHLVGTGTALTISVYNNVNQDQAPSALPDPLPKTLHGVATDASQPNDPVRNTLEDFDGTPLTVNTQLEVVALPSLGGTGDLINLTTALQAEMANPVATRSYVWLASGAPKRVLRSLVAQGLRVDSVKTPGPAVARYNSGGLGLGYQFFVFAAAAAAALAIATTVLSFFLSARRRAFELAVMRALGVPSPTLLRSLVAEQYLVLIPGVLLGLVAALVAALVALPAIPEFGANAGQPPLDLALPVLPLAALALVILGLLAAAAVGSALVAVRGVDLSRLRMEFR